MKIEEIKKAENLVHRGIGMLSPEDWLKINCAEVCSIDNVVEYMADYAKYYADELLNRQYMEFMYPNSD